MQYTLSERDHDTFTLALKVAALSEAKYKHGSVIRRGKAVLGIACNVIKTHPIQSRYEKHTCSIHAEARSIILAKTNIEYSTCYSARISNTKIGNTGNAMLVSKPCKACHALLLEAGVMYIVYYNGNCLVKEKV